MKASAHTNPAGEKKQNEPTVVVAIMLGAHVWPQPVRVFYKCTNATTDFPSCVPIQFSNTPCALGTTWSYIDLCLVLVKMSSWGGGTPCLLASYLEFQSIKYFSLIAQVNPLPCPVASVASAGYAFSYSPEPCGSSIRATNQVVSCGFLEESSSLFGLYKDVGSVRLSFLISVVIAAY